MDLQLRDRIVIITGGASAIGKSIVRAFAAEGAVPVIFGGSPEAGEKLVAELRAAGQEASYTKVDLTSDDEIRGAVEETTMKFGRIDGIVNIAGGNDGVGLEHTPEQFVESLRKNRVHRFALIQYSLHILKEAKGFIVNIGSIVSITGQANSSAYAASKGGLDPLTREWALDLAADGIRVNAVISAEVMTPIDEKSLGTVWDAETNRREIENHITRSRRMTSSQEIADMTVFLASGRSSHTTGQTIYVETIGETA